jgi:putative addiction module component (TIGR02574 family)
MVSQRIARNRDKVALTPVPCAITNRRPSASSRRAGSDALKPGVVARAADTQRPLGSRGGPRRPEDRATRSRGRLLVWLNPARELESKVLKLSRREGARLAQRLISSLDQEVDVHAEELWLQEAERRLDELKSGKVAGIPAEKVIRKARSTLR